MQSSSFLQKANEIRKRDSAVFETLMEFEKTKKISNKSRLNFTIDKSLAVNFKRFCKEKGYNMSAKIEQAIRDIMSKGK
jgi:hypothetical protein